MPGLHFITHSLTHSLMLNVPPPTVPVSYFPSVSTICARLSSEFNLLPANQGGSIVGLATENVIDGNDKIADSDWYTWIEYVYECSSYWADLNGIDC